MEIIWGVFVCVNTFLSSVYQNIFCAPSPVSSWGMNLHLPLEMIPFTWRRRFCLLRRRQPFSSHFYDDYLVAFGPMKSRKK